MGLQEVQKCFAALEQRERLIVKFAILAGLRPEEIFGLNWTHIKKTHVEIRQRSIVGKSTRQRLPTPSGRRHSL